MLQSVGAQAMDVSGGAVGAIGAAAGHRGGGFIAMSVAHVSGTRTMIPKQRGAPGSGGPGARQFPTSRNMGPLMVVQGAKT